MAATAPMALNTPKRLKTAVPSCTNYLSTPPPSVCIGSPPPTSTDAQTIAAGAGQQHALTAAVTTAQHQQRQEQQQHWNWFNEATSPSSSCGSPDGPLNRSFGGHSSSLSTPKAWNSSSGGGGGGGSSAEKSENKRGRPRSEALTTLMVEGSISPSAIKCRYCNRVFPREKSLQAHLRTHTGERPYHCDYPGCTRAFTQSGQLKTHQRLHTGERPFICSAAHCQMRFTHANRHCPDHPYDTLRRCDDFIIQTVPEQNGDVLRWLEKYRAEREDRTPTRKTPKRANNGTSGGYIVSNDGCDGTAAIAANGGPDDEDGHGNTCCGLRNENENLRPSGVTAAATTASPRRACFPNDENNPSHNSNGLGGSERGVSDAAGNNHLLLSPVTPNNTYYKSSRKVLMCALDMNAGLGSPVTSKAKHSLPKLIQWQEPTGRDEDERARTGDEEHGNESADDESFAIRAVKKSTFNPKKKWLRDACQDELAKPLEPNVISQKVFSSTTSTMALKQQLHQHQRQEPVRTTTPPMAVSTTYSSSPVKRQALAPAGHYGKTLPRGDNYAGAFIGNGTSSTHQQEQHQPSVVPAAAIDPNQMRPTVLMVASKDCAARPLSDQPVVAALLNLTNGHGPPAGNQCVTSPKPEENNRKLQGALALMQLAAKDAFASSSVPEVDDLLTTGANVEPPIRYGYDDVSPAASSFSSSTCSNSSSSNSSMPTDSTSASPEEPSHLTCILPRPAAAPFIAAASPNALGTYL